MKKIKILQLTTDSKIGGTEKMLLTLAKNYDRDDFSIDFAVLMPGGPLIDELKKLNVNVYNININKKYKFYKSLKLINILTKNRYDIIHTYLYHSHQIGRILAKLSGTPIIISGHRSPDNWKKFYHKKINAFTSKFADILIANSELTKTSLIQRENISPDKIIVINNGININPQLNNEKVIELKNKFKIPCDKKIIGITANLTEVKDYFQFCDICSKLNTLHSDLFFISIGEGPLKNTIKKYAEQKNITNIKFLGYINNVLELINIYDIFLLTSKWESSPRSILEAMSLGIPVVAPNVGGIPEIVADSFTGYLYNKTNVEEAASKISNLIKDKNLYNNFSQNSIKTVKNKFSLTNFITETQKIYLEYYNKINV